MAIVMEAIAVNPDPPSGYDLFAGIRFGDNTPDGSGGGAPTYDAGATPDDAVGGWVPWDLNIDDGIDSDLMLVDLIVRANNGSSQMIWSMNGQSVTYDAASFSSINQIQIIAGSSAQALMSWSDVSVGFFDDGVQMDSWSTSGNITADQTGEADPQTLENIVTLTPQASGIDEIHVTAKVRIACPQGVYLDQNSVFGQILITTANA